MVHAIHLCHPVINSPCHPVTLSSIHPGINSHLPCRPFTMSSVRIMVHAIHLPCHSFTVSASHHVYQALSHHINARCRDLRSLTRNSSLSCWRPPWRLPLYFFLQYLLLYHTWIKSITKTIFNLLKSLYVDHHNNFRCSPHFLTVWSGCVNGQLPMKSIIFLTYCQDFWL